MSKQDHYDFGLRALTSAIRVAESKRRTEVSLSEEVVLFTVLKDMNLPKLTKTDLTIFNGILNDLFPGVETAALVIPELRDAIVSELLLNKYQPVEVFVGKILQLYESKLMRHGNMGIEFSFYLHF